MPPSLNRRIVRCVVLSVGPSARADGTHGPGRWRKGFWSGLAVMRCLDARTRMIALVLVGPSVGAAGVLLTATGTTGDVAYAAWAGTDRLWALRAVGRRSVPGEATPVGVRP